MKNYMKRNRGFTLIELLVVIAIIGILSSIILSSLSTARSKGKDANAKTSISSARAAAQVYLTDNDDYGTTNGGGDQSGATPTNVCGQTALVETLTSAGLQIAGGGYTVTDTDDVAAPNTNGPWCDVGTKDLADDGVSTPVTIGATYMIWTTLNVPANSTDRFCVDSSGFSGIVSAPVSPCVTDSACMGSDVTPASCVAI